MSQTLKQARHANSMNSFQHYRAGSSPIYMFSTSNSKERSTKSASVLFQVQERGHVLRECQSWQGTKGNHRCFECGQIISKRDCQHQGYNQAKGCLHGPASIPPHNRHQDISMFIPPSFWSRMTVVVETLEGVRTKIMLDSGSSISLIQEAFVPRDIHQFHPNT